MPVGTTVATAGGARATLMAVADWKRAAGSGSSARSTARTRSWSRSGRTEANGSWSPWTTARAVVMALSPPKGLRPVRAS